MGNANHSGSKMSTSEYATRKVIDVVAAVAVPIVTVAAVYYGPAIVDASKNAINKIKNLRKK